MSFHFELSPKRVPLYIEKAKDGHVTPVDDIQIVDFACGNNHTVAIDSKKRAYSWGFGGVGRLGHAEQKDEMVPRLIKFFESSNRGVRRVFCGSSFTLVRWTLCDNLLMYSDEKFFFIRLFPIKVNCICSGRIRRLVRPTCIPSLSKILLVSFKSKICLQLFTLIYFLRMERHGHRLRLHFGHDFSRRFGDCLGSFADFRRVGLGRLAEVISSAEGGHKDGGDEDSSGRYGLLSHFDAR